MVRESEMTIEGLLTTSKP